MEEIDLHLAFYEIQPTLFKGKGILLISKVEKANTCNLFVYVANYSWYFQALTSLEFGIFVILSV
jgi:hypothetical protein